MTSQRKRVRIALELEESVVEEMEQILEGYNTVFSPMKLNRTELIRAAVQEKLVRMRAQLTKLQQA